MIFAGLVLREHMFEGHVTFERNFQKIVKLRKFRRSQGAVTLCNKVRMCNLHKVPAEAGA